MLTELHCRSLRAKVADVQKAAEVARLSDRREHAKVLLAVQVGCSLYTPSFLLFQMLLCVGSACVNEDSRIMQAVQKTGGSACMPCMGVKLIAQNAILQVYLNAGKLLNEGAKMSHTCLSPAACYHLHDSSVNSSSLDHLHLAPKRTMPFYMF